MNEMKTCTVCTESKALFEFSIDSSKTAGYKYSCKKCCAAKLSEWRKANPEKAKDQDKKYRTVNKDKISIKNKKRYTNLTLEEKFEQLFITAKKRKTVEVFISIQYIKDIWEKQEGQCAYTKLPLTSEAHQLNTVSLDRIDSSKDYVEGNIQLVCVPINRMKLDMTEDRFIELCSLVTKNSKLAELPVT
jgi:hypothetical protein